MPPKHWPVRLGRPREGCPHVLGVDLPLAELRSADEHVPQLSDVAGPRVFGERIDGAGGDLGAQAGASEQRWYQQRQVLESIPERGHVDAQDVEPEHEVHSKLTVFGQRGEVTVRRGDDSHVDRALELGTDRPYSPGLKRAQEGRLRGCRELPYFVEEQDAAVR